MWRALSLFVGLMLAAGLYVVVTGEASAHVATPPEDSPSPADFGFALAAGMIALAASMLVSRPRSRMRR
ncbi:MAG: hypothetical protein WDA16_13415 [Candidatus Thermoplasmatota archaeon]|jgi:hypothetical protein